MSLADLVADLKTSMHDSADVFKTDGDVDWVRFLTQSLPDMQVKRPVTRLGSVLLAAGTAVYALASASYPDYVGYKTMLWGAERCMPKPWEVGYAGAVPRVREAWDGAAWTLVFDPAPTYLHLNALGSTFKFWYFARHVLGAAAVDTTVAPGDRALLLLRGQAECLREMALRNANKPTSLRDGITGQTRQGHPAALFQTMLDLFKAAR